MTKAQSSQRMGQFFVITLITLTSVLGIASIPPAFPTIAQHFNLPIEKIGILMGVFTLPGIVLTPIFGFLADKYSRKVILIPSLLIFAIAGIAAAYATTFQELIIFRLLQGIGVSPLGALNISLIGDVFEPKERSKFTGLNGMVLTLGTAFFPLIGGNLALISWNTPFYLAGFGFLTLALYYVYFRNTPAIPTNISIKQIGASFKDKVFSKIIIFNLLSYFLLIGVLFTYIPFLLKNSFGLQSNQIGIYLFVLSISAAISSSTLHLLIRKLGEAGIVKLQFLIFAITLFIIPFLNQTLLFIPVVLFGFAFGVNLPNMQFWVLNITPQEKRASIVAVHRSISQIGQTAGPMLMGLLMSKFLLKDQITVVFHTGAFIALGAFTLSLFMLKKENNSNIN